MFPSRYFNPRYWASRFWPKVGGEPVETPDCNVGVYSRIGKTLSGTLSEIEENTGATSEIVENNGVYSRITDRSTGTLSTIEENTGVASAICQ